jgi:hypothetical protein
VAEVTHLPLVSEDTFAAAQERFRRRSRGQRGRQRSNYVLGGMVKCCSERGRVNGVFVEGQVGGVVGPLIGVGADVEEALR